MMGCVREVAFLSLEKKIWREKFRREHVTRPLIQRPAAVSVRE